MHTIPAIYSLNLKNLISKLFPFHKQETAPIHEWTERHAKLHDPRVSFLESRIAGLEGGVDAYAVKSLRSARFKVIYNLLKRGENVVTFNSWSLLEEDGLLYKRLGIEIRIAAESKVDQFRSLVDANTKLIYLETINRDTVAIPDFIKIISYARLFGIPVVVDNTASVGGYLFAPLKLKANLVIESLEEYLPRTAVLKAVIIDGGNFPWFKHFPDLLKGKIGVHLLDENEILLSETNSLQLVDVLRRKTSTRYSGYPIPNDPFALVRRLEEIPQKAQLKSDNSLLLARLLSKHKYVKEVNYSGIPSGKGYFQALSFFKNGFGHYITFTLAVPTPAAHYFFKELRSHFVLKSRLFTTSDNSFASLSVPAIDYEELKGHFEEAFVKLRDYLHLYSKMEAAAINQN